jgi:hypothetical protein
MTHRKSLRRVFRALVLGTLALAVVGTGVTVVESCLGARKEREEIRRLLGGIPDTELMSIEGDYDVGVRAVILLSSGIEIELDGLVPESFDGQRAVDVHRVDQFAICEAYCPKERPGWQSWSDALVVGPRSSMEAARSLPIHTVRDVSSHGAELRDLVERLPRCAYRTMELGEIYYCTYPAGGTAPRNSFRCPNESPKGGL